MYWHLCARHEELMITFFKHFNMWIIFSLSVSCYYPAHYYYLFLDIICPLLLFDFRHFSVHCYYYYLISDIFPSTTIIKFQTFFGSLLFLGSWLYPNNNVTGLQVKIVQKLFQAWAVYQVTCWWVVVFTLGVFPLITDDKVLILCLFAWHNHRWTIWTYKFCFKKAWFLRSAISWMMPVRQKMIWYLIIFLKEKYILST